LIKLLSTPTGKAYLHLNVGIATLATFTNAGGLGLGTLIDTGVP